MIIRVMWTQRHGEIRNDCWIQTAPDTQHTGHVVGFVSEHGVAKAVVYAGTSLFTMDLDDLTVLESKL